MHHGKAKVGPCGRTVTATILYNQNNPADDSGIAIVSQDFEAYARHV